MLEKRMAIATIAMSLESRFNVFHGVLFKVESLGFHVSKKPLNSPSFFVRI
jgi:hypothetical protein